MQYLNLQYGQKETPPNFRLYLVAINEKKRLHFLWSLLPTKFPSKLQQLIQLIKISVHMIGIFSVILNKETCYACF